VPEGEREHRTVLKQERCWIRDHADTERRRFLRVVMPVPVHGEPRPCNWGVWVELDATVSRRVDELWDDPLQGSEPRLAATLANEIGEFPGSEGLAGSLQLIDERTRPSFFVAESTMHALVKAQRHGVPVEDSIAWVAARVHS
jgi:hypothetical protein